MSEGNGHCGAQVQAGEEYRVVQCPSGLMVSSAALQCSDVPYHSVFDC